MDPALARVGHHVLRRLARHEGVEPERDRLGQRRAAAAGDDADAADLLRALTRTRAAPSRTAASPAPASSAMPRGSRASPTQPIGLPFASPKASPRSRPRPSHMSALLPTLRMRVERQVVRRQAHVRVEEELQPRLHLLADRAERPAPEDPVVAQHELRAGGDGLLEELAVRGDAGDDQLDLPALRAPAARLVRNPAIPALQAGRRGRRSGRRVWSRLQDNRQFSTFPRSAAGVDAVGGTKPGGLQA